MPERPLNDWEDPDPDDESELDADAGQDVYVCPKCGHDVYEDCERCPHCGDYITPRTRSPSAMGGRWMTIVIVLMLIVMLLTAFLLV